MFVGSCHWYGTLLTDENHNPTYTQLYIIDAANALNIRMANPANHNCEVKLWRQSKEFKMKSLCGLTVPTNISKR